MPYKKYIFKILLVFFSIFFILIAVEIFLRISGYNALNKYMDGRELILKVSDDPDVIYELTPGTAGPAWGTDVYINSEGFRGRELDKTRSRKYRIIVLGDSITFGNFLPADGIYSYQTEQLLSDESRDVEVFNFGVGGYDILQDVALLKYKGLKFKPDLVVVGFCLNDVGISSPNLLYLEKVTKWRDDPLFRIRVVQLAANLYEKISLKGWMENQNSQKVFRKNYENQILPIDENERDLLSLMNNLDDAYPSNWYKSKDRIGRLRYAFKELRRLADENGFSVLITIIPWLEVDNRGAYPYKYVHEIIKLEAAGAGLDTVDLTEDFMKVGMKNLRIVNDDHVHPNKLGHSIIAENIAKYVLSNEN